VAYPEKMSREEEEMCEVYARFRIDGVSREDAIRYMMLMEYKLTPRVIHEIKLNDKHIFGL
tara:strand:+ start:581 stop:763 length:183 start_codon:yes stop_codon:yes gene_type:complete